MLELNEVLLKACARDARLRYQSAEAMRADLALLQSGKSVKRRRAWERSSSHAKKLVLAISALALVAAIVFSLPVRKSPAPAIERSKNAEANDAYLNGNITFHTDSAGAFAQAAKYFERAIELDPKFAAAYARLAKSYIWLDPSSPEILKNARLLGEKALSLNRRLADAHEVVGWTKAVLDRDWRGAEKEYLYSIRLNPSSEEHLYGYASFLVIAGRSSEAVRQVEKALTFDSPTIVYLQNAAFVFSAAHQYDRAIQKIEQVIEKEPSSRMRLADRFLVPAYREKGDYSKAIQVEEEAALLKGENPEHVKDKFNALREACDRGGARGYWQQQLKSSKNDENNPGWLAALYARVGDKDKAFSYLNLAFERTPTELVFQINKDPSFDKLRGDRRFLDVLKKLGLSK